MPDCTQACRSPSSWTTTATSPSTTSMRSSSLQWLISSRGIPAPSRARSRLCLGRASGGCFMLPTSCSSPGRWARASTPSCTGWMVKRLSATFDTSIRCWARAGLAHQVLASRLRMQHQSARCRHSAMMRPITRIPRRQPPRCERDTVREHNCPDRNQDRSLVAPSHSTIRARNSAQRHPHFQIAVLL